MLAGPLSAQSQAIRIPAKEVELVKRSLASPQRQSFARDREYCAYLGRLSNGRLKVTAYNEGGRNGCTPLRPGGGFRPIASIHTHGAYDPRVPAEFPTTLDMDMDRAEGINGYVATPGGRLWYLDSRSGVAVQLCSIGCLNRDPAFRPGDDGVIRRSYSYDQLKRLEFGG
ncbi:MAG: DUF4329 domain-containing protein [Paracoccaceae bacterium]